MKLVRFGDANREKPGLKINDTIYDVSRYFDDYNEEYFANDGLNKLKDIAGRKDFMLPVVSQFERLGSPISRPSKIVCIGLNYLDHALETGLSVPSEPVLFFKSTTSLSGPFDDIIIPHNSKKTDWEVELAVIIGKRASYVLEEEAMDYIAGYSLHNDVSEREFQLERGGQWVKGKSCDSFAPLGPWFVTPDEIKDVNNLGMWLKVNDEVKQQSNTKNLIFKIPFLISYVSQFMTLLPGDIISTGTPAGVGLGFDPPVYLKPGDLVELGIDSLGVSKQLCISFKDKYKKYI
jgi:2-keto-4-pentenoate hydratase/2-oxohepta-3-ene-1,7-dioic acid hydratase in catechol pathway